jgi:hypothetical protein
MKSDYEWNEPGEPTKEEVNATWSVRYSLPGRFTVKKGCGVDQIEVGEHVQIEWPCGLENALVHGTDREEIEVVWKRVAACLPLHSM